MTQLNAHTLTALLLALALLALTGMQRIGGTGTAAASAGSDRLSSTSCEKMNRQAAAPMLPDRVQTPDHKAAAPAAPASGATSCSLSLQMIPADAPQLRTPDADSRPLAMTDHIPLPRILVFQEPDPPRLG